MLFGMMIPVQAMVIPLYYNLQNLGLINTRWAMVIPVFWFIDAICHIYDEGLFQRFTGGVNRVGFH